MAIQTPTLEYERALAENARYAAQFDRSSLPMPPGRKLAVLACMDARLTVEDVLGLRSGDAHIIRNAGGLATDDAIRSLVISQQLLGTEEVIVIEHTGCGMLTFQDAEVHQRAGQADRQRRRPRRSTRFRTSSRTCASRSAGSGRTRGSRTCRCTAWSTRWRRGACARSSDPTGAGHEDARRGTDPSRGSSSIGSVASTGHTPFG